MLAGRYRVDEYIGGGGMGDVYKVWDTARSCYLAIKVMRQNLAEFEELAHRFEREAEALSRLQHPNIVRLYGLERDEDEELAFIVMDYVDGPTLAEKLKLARGPLPLTEVVSMTEDVAAALSYAHNQAIYHRDIKPSNIIIARDGRAILSDFGIARLSDALTMTYQGIGTPAYMSPEQCEGKEAGAPSDIYSLGVVLYESLVGRRPFLGDLGRGEPPTTANIIREHVELPPPPPRDINPSLQPQVEAVVMRALAKDPQYRYESAADLARELRVAAGGAALPSLRVTSTPGGAHVYVDGELRGASPLDITRLPEGSHVVRIAASGYEDYEQTIGLPEFRSLDVQLEPLAGATVVAPGVAVASGEGGAPPPVPPIDAKGQEGPRRPRWWLRAALGLAGGGIIVGVLALLFMLSRGGDEEEGDAVIGSPTPTPSAQITYLATLDYADASSKPTKGKLGDEIASIEGELFTQAIATGFAAFGSPQRFVDYDLSGKFQRFEAEVGIHDNIENDTRIQFQVLADGRTVFETEVPVRTGDPPLPISINVEGVQTLTLVNVITRNDNCGFVGTCWAVWGDARVIRDEAASLQSPTGTPPSSMEISYLIDLPYLEEERLAAFGKAGNDIPSIEGQLFTRAIVMTLREEFQTFIMYDLGGRFQRFEAEAGLHDSIANDTTASVEFRLLGDGKELFSTQRPLRPADPALPVQVDVSGVQQLMLFTKTHSGPGYSSPAAIVWGDARVLRDETATPQSPGAAGGSSEIIYLMDLPYLEEERLAAFGKAGRDIPSIGGQLFTRAIVLTLREELQTFIVYDLAGEFQRFEAEVGIHDSIADESMSRVEFRVLGDGKELFITERPFGPADSALPIQVDVEGVKQLTLLTTTSAGPAYSSPPVIISGDPKITK